MPESAVSRGKFRPGGSLEFFGGVHDEFNMLLQSYILNNQPRSERSAVVKIPESSSKKEKKE
jgi:hypothetical protein